MTVCLKLVFVEQKRMFCTCFSLSGNSLSHKTGSVYCFGGYDRSLVNWYLYVINKQLNCFGVLYFKRTCTRDLRIR